MDKTIQQNQEQWKELSNIDPNYTIRVSSTGKISIKLHGTRDSSGRQYVNIAGSDIPIDWLVAKAFNANPMNGNDVHHKDNNMSNNSAINLVWFSNPDAPQSYPISKFTSTITQNASQQISQEKQFVPPAEHPNAKDPALFISQTSKNSSRISLEHLERLKSGFQYITKSDADAQAYIESKQESGLSYEDSLKYGAGNPMTSQPRQQLPLPQSSQISHQTNSPVKTNNSAQIKTNNVTQQSYDSCSEFIPKKTTHIVNIPEYLNDEQYIQQQMTQNQQTEIPVESVSSDNRMKSMFVNYNQPSTDSGLEYQSKEEYNLSRENYMNAVNNSGYSVKPSTNTQPIVQSAGDAFGYDGYSNSQHGKLSYEKEGVKPIELDMSKGSSLVQNGIVYNRPVNNVKSGTSYNDWENNVDIDTLQVKGQRIKEISMEQLLETGIKGGNYNKKKVCCTLRNGAEKVFDSVNEAAEFCGVDHSSISKCCRGKIGLVKGMHFRYVELEDIESVLDMYLSDVEEAANKKLNIDMTPKKPGRPVGTTKEAMAIRRAMEEINSKKKKRKNKK